MRVYPKNRYVAGTYKRECDSCGWDYLRSELKIRWDGFIVCERDWYPTPRGEVKYKNIKEEPFRKD